MTKDNDCLLRAIIVCIYYHENDVTNNKLRDKIRQVGVQKKLAKNDRYIAQGIMYRVVQLVTIQIPLTVRMECCVSSMIKYVVQHVTIRVSMYVGMDCYVLQMKDHVVINAIILQPKSVTDKLYQDCIALFIQFINN